MVIAIAIIVDDSDINPTKNNEPVIIILYISVVSVGAKTNNSKYIKHDASELIKYNNVAWAYCFFTNSFFVSIKYIISGIAQAK